MTDNNKAVGAQAKTRAVDTSSRINRPWLDVMDKKRAADTGEGAASKEIAVRLKISGFFCRVVARNTLKTDHIIRELGPTPCV